MGTGSIGGTWSVINSLIQPDCIRLQPFLVELAFNIESFLEGARIMHVAQMRDSVMPLSIAPHLLHHCSETLNIPIFYPYP
jgi:hypothetical protein